MRAAMTQGAWLLSLVLAHLLGQCEVANDNNTRQDAPPKGISIIGVHPRRSMRSPRRPWKDARRNCVLGPRERRRLPRR